MAKAKSCPNCQPGKSVCIVHHRAALQELEDRLGAKLRELQVELTSTRSNARFLALTVENMQLPDQVAS